MPPRKRPVSHSAAPPPAAICDPGQHLAGFLHYLEAECGLAGNTVQAYQSDLRQFSDWYRRYEGGPFHAATLAMFMSFLQHLHERGLSASTIARRLVALKMFFRYLVLEGVLQESVADLLNAPKLWSHLPHVLSTDMVNRLLEAPGPDDRFALRDRALLVLLYATGCRASEVVRLRLRDLQAEEGYCRCLGKGNKERIVHLNPHALTIIKAYLEQVRPCLVAQRGAEELLLSRTGQPLTRIMVWKLVKKYARRIGASGRVSPHTLRHSFATHMLAGGAEIRALQELLGHANIATTQIYTHVEHSRLKAIHQRCHPRG